MVCKVAVELWYAPGLASRKLYVKKGIICCIVEKNLLYRLDCEEM